jgi:hypothetical protein
MGRLLECSKAVLKGVLMEFLLEKQRAFPLVALSAEMSG